MTFRIWFKNKVVSPGQLQYKEVQSKSLAVLQKRAAQEVEMTYSVWPDGRRVTFAEHGKMDLNEKRSRGIVIKTEPSEIIQIETRA
jgi:hypothetical protein